MKRLLNIVLLFTALNLSAGSNKKPNILFLFTDDQTIETIGGLNNKEILTPHLDELVKNGTTFNHCYNQGSWSAAVCVASRTMLITGQTLFHAPRNIKYLDEWAYAKQVTPDTLNDVPLWPAVFAKNGYETFLTGKWHNSHYSITESFDIRSTAFKLCYIIFNFKKLYYFYIC